MDHAPTPSNDDGPFVRRVMITLGLVAAFGMVFWLLQLAGHGMLIVVSGVVIAVLLDGMTRQIPLPRIPAMIVLLLVSLLVAAGLSWWMGAAFVEQMEGVHARVIEAWPRVLAWMNESTWGQAIVEELEKFKWAEQSGRFGDVLFATAGGIATLVLIPVFGVFFALAPDIYLGAGIHLLPVSRRARVREVLGHVGHALRIWFVGRFASMTVVGVGSGLGLLAAGVPMPAALGVIAGVLSFVPNVGPPLAAIPGVLVGLSQSPATAAWAVGVYVGVQAIDNYLVTPFVDQFSVDVPPATQLGAQLLLGLAAGAIGVFLATPLMIALIVMVQAFYVQDALHDPVRLLGAKRGPDDPPARRKPQWPSWVHKPGSAMARQASRQPVPSPGPHPSSPADGGS